MGRHGGREGRCTEAPACLPSSLVSTNEHLLQELGQARVQHRAEAEQLHWSYRKLRKTMALFPRSRDSSAGRVLGSPPGSVG